MHHEVHRPHREPVLPRGPRQRRTPPEPAGVAEHPRGGALRRRGQGRAPHRRQREAQRDVRAELPGAPPDHQRRPEGEGGLHLRQHRGGQVAHAEPDLLQRRERVPHLRRAGVVHAGRLGRVRPGAEGDLPGHRGPAGRHEEGGPADAAAPQGAGRVRHRDLPHAGRAAAARHVHLPRRGLAGLQGALRGHAEAAAAVLRRVLVAGARRDHLPRDEAHEHAAVRRLGVGRGRAEGGLRPDAAGHRRVQLAEVRRGAGEGCRGVVRGVEGRGAVGAG